MLTDGITPFVIGGMQKHSYLIAKQLIDSGVELELHHCLYRKEPLDQLEVIFDSELVKFFSHHFPEKGKLPGHYIRNSYKYSVLLFEQIKNRLDKFDFIYTKGFTGWKLIKEKRKGLKCPPIGVKFHGYEMFQKAASLKVNAEHLLLRSSVSWITKNADYVFSYGGGLTRIIKNLGVQEENIVEISGGIESSFVRDQIQNLSAEYVHFCFVGRNERRKGITELNHAIAQLITSNNYFKFDFIGPIEDKHKILSDNIRYHGEVNSIETKKNILDSCDVLVCPSYSEGMPNVILEAMARGCAIIATNVGAVNLLVSTQNGILLNEPSPKLIANAMLSFIKMPSNNLEDLKRHSLMVIKKFTWDNKKAELLQKLNIIVNGFN